jgi:hypothetical protein
VLYLERIPSEPLVRYVRTLWYAQDHGTIARRERILPSGCLQVIVSLARDFLLDCPEGARDRRVPPALVVGARSIYEIVDSSRGLTCGPRTLDRTPGTVYVACALSTTFTHLGSGEEDAPYSSCQFHHLYGAVCG